MTEPIIVIICPGDDCGIKYSVPQDTGIAICPKCDYAIDLTQFQNEAQG